MISWFRKKSPPAFEMPAEMKAVLKIAFPNGNKQQQEEGRELSHILDGLITAESASSLVLWTKCRLILSEVPLPDEVVIDGIFRHEQGKLSLEQSDTVYRFVGKKMIMAL